MKKQRTGRVTLPYLGWILVFGLLSVSGLLVAVLTSSVSQEWRLVTQNKFSFPSKQDNRRATIQRLMNHAEKDLRSLRLTVPAGNNAYYRYRKVLELDPGNSRAITGIKRIAKKYIYLADRAIAQGKYDKADGYLKKAERISRPYANIEEDGSKSRAIPLPKEWD